jgi:hypothetical protein
MVQMSRMTDDLGETGSGGNVMQLPFLMTGQVARKVSMTMPSVYDSGDIDRTTNT